MAVAWLVGFIHDIELSGNVLFPVSPLKSRQQSITYYQGSAHTLFKRKPMAFYWMGGSLIFSLTNMNTKTRAI